MYDGWVKLQRKLFRSRTFYGHADRIAVFCYLFAHAAYQDTTYELGPDEIELKRGQVVVTVRSLSNALGLHRSNVERVLKVLKNRDTIETQPETHGTVVTICNYSLYQSDPEKPRHSRDTTRDTVETLNRKKEERKEESTDSESPSDTYGQLALTGDDPDPEEPDRFDEWWSCWAIPGTKRDKKTARSKYAGIVKRKEATQQQLIDGLKAYMVYCHGMKFGPDKIKHPDRWLNAGAWANEHVVTNTGGSANGKLDPRAMAERLAAELGGSDGTANQAHGVGPGNEPDRQGRSRSSDRANGQGVPEIPAWFDQEGG